MAEFNRDIRVAAKIAFYCEKIEQAARRFGNTMESFQSDKTDVPALRAYCEKILRQAGYEKSDYNRDE
jgi:hypothetical protein